jgi:formylglycine-generating enzyme required for sulfatase activity
MSDVFISYSRKNTPFARRLLDKLILVGKDAWVDWEGIPLTSPNWWSEIKTGIEGADNFVLILSPDSMASVVCNMELDYAIDLNKRIVPVIYRDVETRDAFASIADFTPDEAMEERLAGKDPLIIARDNWQRLSHINWVFFRDEDDFDAAFETLVTTVDTDLEYVKAHTRYLIRAQEWERENQRADLLLFGGEIDRAEAWLQKAEGYAAAARASAGEKELVVNPLPQTLHHDYIRISRDEDMRRRRLLRNLRIGTLTFASVGVIAVILAIGSLITGQQAQSRADLAATQAADAQALRNTVIFEATAFSVQQERAGTQVGGLGMIPQREVTISAQDIIAEATQIAVLAAWQPISQEFNGIEMVQVPAGCFWMGSIFHSDHADAPVHQQCFDAPFWIGKYEVSNAEYTRFIDDGAYDNPDYWTVEGWDWRRENTILQPEEWENRAFSAPRQPVIGVNWYEAVAYAHWSEMRLCSEREWEYAARGPNSYMYPWGNEFVPDNLVYRENSGNNTAPVASRPGGASWVGALNMSGNVWEWTLSEGRDYPYITEDGRENIISNSRRVMRGGSWHNNEISARAMYRLLSDPFTREVTRGFRLCRPVDNLSSG